MSSGKNDMETIHHPKIETPEAGQIIQTPEGEEPLLVLSRAELIGALTTMGNDLLFRLNAGDDPMDSTMEVIENAIQELCGESVDQALAWCGD